MDEKKRDIKDINVAGAGLVHKLFSCQNGRITGTDILRSTVFSLVRDDDDARPAIAYRNANQIV
jgi:hypothetical protein